jgi:hypothetical protein
VKRRTQARTRKNTAQDLGQTTDECLSSQSGISQTDETMTVNGQIDLSKTPKPNDDGGT